MLVCNLGSGNLLVNEVIVFCVIDGVVGIPVTSLDIIPVEEEEDAIKATGSAVLLEDPYGTKDDDRMATK